MFRISVSVYLVYTKVLLLRYMQFAVKARQSFAVEHLPVVQWVVGLIPHGGPIELFLFPASAP